jgi:hypothetical protein
MFAASALLPSVTLADTMCAGDPAPSGWIVYDDVWDFTTCGAPQQRTYNVWLTERCGERQYKAERPSRGTMSPSPSENPARVSYQQPSPGRTA